VSVDQVRLSGTSSPATDADVDAYFPHLRHVEDMGLWIDDADIPVVREKLKTVIDCLKRSATGKVNDENIARFNRTRREIEAIMQPNMGRFSDIGPLTLPDPRMMGHAYLKGINLADVEIIAYEPLEPSVPPKEKPQPWSFKLWRLELTLRPQAAKEPPPQPPTPAKRATVSFRYANLEDADFRLAQFDRDYIGPILIDLSVADVNAGTSIADNEFMLRDWP
jgi:hypothetical protein